ncbi:MAG: glycosyltransferase family 4 protein [Beijerinckiaceae bacterium]
MRIALISFEYGGGPSGGGIGAYVRNAAQMLAARGHSVEVFCGDADASIDSDTPYRINRVTSPRQEFSDAVLLPFSERHNAIPFNVVEGPEYGADAAGIRNMFPGVPLVVRLHTPGELIGEINASYVNALDKIRFVAGGLIRGRVNKPYWRRTRDEHALERLHAREADLVVAPSRAILDRLRDVWGLSEDKCEVVPNVFVPASELLSLEPAKSPGTVLFLGRLEVRKGVLELARAVPMIAQAVPEVRFLFVGSSAPMPGGRRRVRDAMLGRYGRSAGCVCHMDSVPYAQVPRLIGEAAVVVAPSAWENFPYVCLEGMSAARAVIGSSAGGMAEIIDNGETGLLVPPRSPAAIARAVTDLLRDPDRRSALGLAARKSVLERYSPSVVGPLQEETYRLAIRNAASREACKVRCAG